MSASVSEEVDDPPAPRPLSSVGLCRLVEVWEWKEERREAREEDLEGLRGVGFDPLEESLMRRDTSLRESEVGVEL